MPHAFSTVTVQTAGSAFSRRTFGFALAVEAARAGTTPKAKHKTQKAVTVRQRM
jgi:hypothetical protein